MAGAAIDALAERYGGPPGILQSANDVIESLLAHRSVRAYTPDPLPDGTLEQLVAAAQSAASSSNLQLWSVVAVRDPARKQRLATLAGGQAHIVEAPLFLVWLADVSRAERVAAARDIAADGVHFFETFMVALIDAALAAQNAVVAAESLRLGTVYIGAMRNHPEQVAAELGLAPGVMAAFGLCVGHPDPARPTAIKPRLEQPVVLHHERYDASSELAGVARYDAALGRFLAGQRMVQAGWSTMVANRLRGAASLSGRDRMRSALQALGFELR